LEINKRNLKSLKLSKFKNCVKNRSVKVVPFVFHPHLRFCPSLLRSCYDEEDEDTSEETNCSESEETCEDEDEGEEDEGEDTTSGTGIQERNEEDDG
jgi:hypothetical protein